MASGHDSGLLGDIASNPTIVVAMLTSCDPSVKRNIRLLCKSTDDMASSSEGSFLGCSNLGHHVSVANCYVSQVLSHSQRLQLHISGEDVTDIACSLGKKGYKPSTIALTMDVTSYGRDGIMALKWDVDGGLWDGVLTEARHLELHSEADVQLLNVRLTGRGVTSACAC
jgi:hypothetical protein